MARLPSRRKCAQLLAKYNYPHPDYADSKHHILVNKLAVWIAESMREKGARVNVELVDRASLLHDIDQSLPKKHHTEHGKLGARIMREEGYPEIARIIEVHNLDSVLDAKTSPETLEEKIVYYADKRVIQEIIDIDTRFNNWVERHAKTPEDREKILKPKTHLKAIEKELFSVIGKKPDQIPEFN